LVQKAALVQEDVHQESGESMTLNEIERIKARAERINDVFPGLINWENDAILLLPDYSHIVDLDTATEAEA